MTEPTGEAEATAPAGRGRPRPDETVQRDKVVLEYLTTNGAKSRKEIAEGTSIPGNEVYLSLYRLSRAGSIGRDGAKWTVAGTSPAEVAAE